MWLRQKLQVQNETIFVFSEIALKSANKTKYWLIIIQESAPQLKEEVSKLYQESDELSKIIALSVLTLKGKK